MEDLDPDWDSYDPHSVPNDLLLCGGYLATLGLREVVLDDAPRQQRPQLAALELYPFES